MIQDYFDLEVARECGVNAATVATFLWERLISDPNLKYRHGLAWTKVSQRMMTIALPYLTIDQIAYAVNKLIDLGYIKKGHYDINKFDHTNWYAFTKYGSKVMNFGEEYEYEDD